MSLNNENLEKKLYGGASRESILNARKSAAYLHKQRRLGQRTIAQEIKARFLIELSENTISGWIHRDLVPFANERTHFKPKPVPPKLTLEKLYVNEKRSASEIAKIFEVSVGTAIHWLKQYKISLRSHIQSMNTLSVKQKLGEGKLKYPSKEYRRLTPAKAYLLGVLCGDGYINKKQIKLEIRNDEEFITAFSDSIAKVYGLHHQWRFYKKRKTLLLSISSMILAEDLLRYGDFRTWTWFVPKEIITSENKEIIASFVRGVYDSESSVGNYNINLTTASPSGAHQLRFLLHKLGIENRLTITKKKYHTIIIGGKKNLKLFDKLIGLTILRKREKLHSMYKQGWEK